MPGGTDDFPSALAAAQREDARLRQTSTGPHRDDVLFSLNEIASDYASEGQQRTVALALKIAQARTFALEEGTPPLLLIDDIFGELDPSRRNALLAHLPADAQKLVTATTMQWRENEIDGQVFELRERQVIAREGRFKS